MARQEPLAKRGAHVARRCWLAARQQNLFAIRWATFYHSGQMPLDRW